MLCIVHYQPVELYPPVQNMIRFLGIRLRGEKELHVFTTHAPQAGGLFQFAEVNLHRIGRGKKIGSKICRAISYMNFLIITLIWLVRIRPFSVLYFETLSSGGPILYKRIFNKKCRLFIHYHEYMTPEEYQNGMMVSRMLHQLEKSIYKEASWISQTNQDRLSLFIKDIDSIPSHLFRVMPNYPPAIWGQVVHPRNITTEKIIHFVYVGSISIKDFYFVEIARWVAAHSGQCIWDIYTNNYDQEILEFLDCLGATNIHFKGSVAYDALPNILPKYRVGLILYKGLTPNFIYNIPNKFYEYYSCGLDIWFPNVMKSCIPMVTQNTYPKVLALDFTRLSEFSLQELVSLYGCRYENNLYAYEEVYEIIWNEFKKCV